MVLPFRFKLSLASLLICLCAVLALAQSNSPTSSDEIDPVKLFDLAQNAHEKGDLERAVQLYDEALKVRPAFPEAEYQRAGALISLNRFAEAEKSLRRAIELRSTWALPSIALGSLLVRLNLLTEAEQSLARALQLEPQNAQALTALTDLRLRTKASRESLQDLLNALRAATMKENASAALWTARGSIERALGMNAAALASFDHALGNDPRNVAALMARAMLHTDAGDYARATTDAQAAQEAAHRSLTTSLLLANIYVLSGKTVEARSVLDKLDETEKQQPAVRALYAQLLPAGNDVESCRALEKIASKQTGNASLLARLGACFRTSDPARSLQYYRRAVELEPRNADYATGCAAALVQARQFAAAVSILRRILALTPDHYAAHANLATALYEMKNFNEALTEYQWLVKAKPDLAIAYFFIATAHDQLGEYPEALTAYETFLAHADARTNQLEIDKVNLRLPGLRAQIKQGEGSKRKK